MRRILGRGISTSRSSVVSLAPMNPPRSIGSSMLIRDQRSPIPPIRSVRSNYPPRQRPRHRHRGASFFLRFRSCVTFLTSFHRLFPKFLKLRNRKSRTLGRGEIWVEPEAQDLQYLLQKWRSRNERSRSGLGIVNRRTYVLTLSRKDILAIIFYS